MRQKTVNDQNYNHNGRLIAWISSLYLVLVDFWLVPQHTKGAISIAPMAPMKLELFYFTEPLL